MKRDLNMKMNAKKMKVLVCSGGNKMENGSMNNTKTLALTHVYH